VDNVERSTGNLGDGQWAKFPTKEIDDPSDKKPSDWVDDKMMDDPNDHKPAGYDDIPAMIRDPDATKPEDWDDDLDGEWEAPEIDNPEYKGKWAPKKIENPAYKGPWVHPEIANPDYEHDSNIYRFKDIGAVGIDIWQVKAGTIFDNILVTDSISEAEAHAKKYFLDLKDSEKKMFDDIEQKRKDAEEAERKKAEEERKADEAAEDDGDDEKADKAHEDL